MEALYLIPFMLLLGWLFSKYTRKTGHDDKFVAIDDKNFIMDGKFISLETDTDIDKMKQSTEDNKHWSNYVLETLQYDRTRTGDEYLKTIKAIFNNPELKDCVTEKGLEDITEEYEQYVKMNNKCWGDSGGCVLTKEEYLIKKLNPSYCASFTMFLIKPMSIYNIYSESTAKFRTGDMKEIMKERFKKEYY